MLLIKTYFWCLDIFSYWKWSFLLSLVLPRILYFQFNVTVPSGAIFYLSTSGLNTFLSAMYSLLFSPFDDPFIWLSTDSVLWQLLGLQQLCATWIWGGKEAEDHSHSEFTEQIYTVNTVTLWLHGIIWVVIDTQICCIVCQCHHLE